MNNSRLFIPHPLAVRLGRFIAAWSNVELMMEGIIWTLSGLEWSKGRLFTAPLQTHAKIKMINGLLRHRTDADSLIPTWNALAAKAGPLQERRNDLVHSAWMRTPFGPFRVKTRGAPNDRPKVPNPPLDIAGADFNSSTPEELDDLIDRTLALYEELSKFYVSFAPAWPGTQLAQSENR